MLQELVLRFTPMVVLALLLFLICIKLLLLRDVKASNKDELFFGSFFILGNKPSTVESKQLFYKRSNVLNGVIYGLILLVVAFYMLMRSIG